jgi:calcineurin-like phosphoesterase family protein
MMRVEPDKRTLWWILGDVAMEESRLALLDRVPGRKRLVLGNHDNFPSVLYLRYFESLHGTEKHYDMWLSHVPIHEWELFGRVNIHGHSHSNPVEIRDDPRYLNACIEWLPNGVPISLEEVRAEFKRRGV